MNSATNKSVKFDSQPKAATNKKAADKYDDDDFYDDDFESSPPPKQSQTKTLVANNALKSQTVQNPSSKSLANPKPTSTIPSQQSASQTDKKPLPSYNDVEAANQTNRYIIYKFMKRGFTSLSAEDLACTMVNPDFTIDFRKNTGEDWSSQYQFKVIERLNQCKFNLQWVTKRQSDNSLDPFFQMVKDGDISRVVDFLRQHNVDEVLDSVEPNSKKSPLHVAAAEGHVQMCEFLLHKGAKVDARDKLLRTALHLACQGGHAPVVKLLLDANADPMEKDQSGRTAMHYACCSMCVEQITLLCEHGPDLVHVKDHAGRTPLHYTVFNSNPRQVEMALKLLNMGADVNALDSDRRTALHHAAEAGKARVIPLLVQRGASTGTKDSLKGKTPLELAANDHIKELIIVHSSPNYIPRQDDLAQGLQVEGMKMKIEPEPVDIYGMKGGSVSQRKNPPINKKSPSKSMSYKMEDQKNQYDQDYLGSMRQAPPQDYYRPPLGPAKEWEKVQEQYLPYNIRNYQDRLLNFLKRVQEFGVQSYQHAKKPYLFTGSWMEYVRSMDDLMLQINGTKPNEAVMKVFNILFPYDKPLPAGRGDELSLQGFYTGLKGHIEADNSDCDPDLLRQKLEAENEANKQNVLRNNEVEDLQDLLDLKRQLMALESVNNMHVLTIEEKDRKIKELTDELNAAKNAKGKTDLMSEEQYLVLLSENSDLKIQIQQMAQQLEISATKLEEFTRLLESDEARKRKEMEEMKNYTKLQELQMQNDELVRKLSQEKERNRALRFKAGQIFLTTLEKGGSGLPKNVSAKNTEGDYYLSDDEALMRLLQKVEALGEPGLHQRLKDAGEPDMGTITKSQFINFLTKVIGMTPPDVLAIQRIVGFYDGGAPVERLKVSDIMLRIMERAGKRGQIEQDTLKSLAKEFNTKGYSIQDAFAHLDSNESGTVTAKELQDALSAMKIMISKQTLMNILHLFDTNGDNQISLEEFERQMSKYMQGNGRIKVPTDIKDIDSKIISDEMKKELVQEMQAEVKKKVVFEDFSLKPMEIDDMKRKEQLILESIKKGTLPQEMISGEIKLQFDEGVNLIQVPGKAVPFIKMTIVNYTNDGQKVEQDLNSNPCVGFYQKNKFDTAVRIPIINKDKNKIADQIVIQYYLQSNETQVVQSEAVFIGECYLPWKATLSNDGQWLVQRIGLADPFNKCQLAKVQGMVKIFAKWIPVGHEESKYDQTGARKEAVQQPQIASKRTQLEGSSGKLEVYLQKYTHPENLDTTEKYAVEITFQGSTGTLNKSIARVAQLNEINLADVRTLAVNDIVKDRALQIRLLNSKNVEISKTVIDVSKACYIQPEKMILLKAQTMNIEGKPEVKGTLQMKLRFLESKTGETGGKVQVTMPSVQPKEEEKKEESVPVIQNQPNKPIVTPAPAKEEVKMPVKQPDLVPQTKVEPVVQKQPTQKPPVEEEFYQEIKIGGTQAMNDEAGGGDDGFIDEDFE